MKPNKVFLALGTGIVTVAAFAISNPDKLTVNGQPSEAAPIVQDGETYIPLSALQAGGAQVQTVGDTLSIRFNPLAGMDQMDAIQGIPGEWLNNNLVRVRFTNSRMEGGKFKIDMELANLTAEPLNPTINLGMGFPELYGPDGPIPQTPNTSSDYSKNISQRMTQGATGKATLTYDGNPGEEGRILVRFTMNTARQHIVDRLGGFKKPGPNFRVQL